MHVGKFVFDQNKGRRYCCFNVKI